MDSFDDFMLQGGSAAIAEAGRFFMRDGPVHTTLREIAKRFDALHIDYAIAGGMALVAHGYDRTTVDVDVLVSADGLDAAHRAMDGVGYVPPFAGSKNLRDTHTGVRIKFLVAGLFPGDGKPKPVAFPLPASASTEIDGIKYVNLDTLVELKLASGMTNPGRLRDLADVQELIRTLRLPADHVGRLDPYVRERFSELWAAVRNDVSEPR